MHQTTEYPLFLEFLGRVLESIFWGLRHSAGGFQGSLGRWMLDLYGDDSEEMPAWACQPSQNSDTESVCCLFWWRESWAGTQSLRDSMRSSDVRMELKVELLLLRVERTQLRQLGYLAKIPPGLLPEEVFQACPLGRRPQCRSRTRWRDDLFLGNALGFPTRNFQRAEGRWTVMMASNSGLKRRSHLICGTFYLNETIELQVLQGHQMAAHCVQISCGYPNDWALSSEGNDLVLTGQCCSSQCPPYKGN